MMAYFVVHALDAPNKVAARAQNRDAHRARLRAPEQALTVRVGGPLLDEAGEMCGSTLIIEAEDAAQVNAFIAEDPYTLAGVYDEVRVHRFNWGLTQLEES